MVVCSILACSPTAVSAGGIPAKTLKELKAATVYIKVQFQSQAGKPIPATGSGFVVHVENGVGYIATNNHVINPLAGERSQGPPKVVLHSGTPDELTVDALVGPRTAARSGHPQNHRGQGFAQTHPAGSHGRVLETLPVFALGFPFGGNLAMANPTRPSPSPRE